LPLPDDTAGFDDWLVSASCFLIDLICFSIDERCWLCGSSFRTFCQAPSATLLLPAFVAAVASYSHAVVLRGRIFVTLW